MPDTGPYADDRAAHAAAIAAIPPGPGRVILSGVQKRRLIESVCTAAGVELGAYDRHILDWLAGWNDSTCAVIAGLIHRGHESGKTAALEGSATQWGLRLTGDSGEPIFDRYPSEDAARDSVPTFQGVFDTVVVRCQVTPWKAAQDG